MRLKRKNQKILEGPNFEGPILKSVLEEPGRMASTRRHSAAVIDNGADKDPLANGSVGFGMLDFLAFVFVSARDPNV